MREAKADVVAAIVVVTAIGIGTPIFALAVMPAMLALGVLAPAVLIWRRIRGV